MDVKVGVGMNDRKAGMNGCLNGGCLRKWNADFHDHHDLSGILAHSIMIDPSNHDNLRSSVIAANKKSQIGKPKPERRLLFAFSQKKNNNWPAAATAAQLEYKSPSPKKYSGHKEMTFNFTPAQKAFFND